MSVDPPPAAPSIGAELEAAFLAAFAMAERRRHATVTLEHLLLSLLQGDAACALLSLSGADPAELERELSEFVDLAAELPPDSPHRPVYEAAVHMVLNHAAMFARGGGRSTIDAPDLLAALMRQTDAYATLAIAAQGVSRVDLLRRIAHGSADFTIPPPTDASPVAVILHNDSVTTMEFVVELLSSLFELSPGRARSLMLEIHQGGQSGHGRVCVMPAELGRERALEAMRLAEEAGFPLRLTIEPL